MIIKLTAIMKALMEHQSLEWSYDHWVYYLNLTHVLPDADDEYFTASPARVWSEYESDTPDYMYNAFEREDNRYFIDICRDLLDQLSEEGYDVLDDSDTLPASKYIDPPAKDEETEEDD